MNNDSSNFVLKTTLLEVSMPFHEILAYAVAIGVVAVCFSACFLMLKKAFEKPDKSR
ncbi:hypothetical protein SAMN05660443_0254 [Marinospirillum celere]|uniref:Uncharacterized protein n=1 Tax=Marinospirillum celere TaxID=1122252 RepID=A0A1I1E784_9GAMM|nr:hypothetical protein [Marinospirillum celere]SFB80810.1 hypothetical protein SAMN05660443_0254 [Marinospirillum celere]